MPWECWKNEKADSSHLFLKWNNLSTIKHGSYVNIPYLRISLFNKFRTSAFWYTSKNDYDDRTPHHLNWVQSDSVTVSPYLRPSARDVTLKLQLFVIGHGLGFLRWKNVNNTRRRRNESARWSETPFAATGSPGFLCWALFSKRLRLINGEGSIWEEKGVTGSAISWLLRLIVLNREVWHCSPFHWVTLVPLH